MSVDLGDLAGLATAVGLLDDTGNPVESWFRDPGAHLSNVLSNPVQRNALVEFVDDFLGGEEATTDEHGVSWLPIVEVDNGTFRLFITVQEDGGGATIRIGAGVKVRIRASGGVDCDVDAHVPLFVASGTSTVSDPLLLGKPGAPIVVSLALRLPPATAPGRVELGAVELAANVPTVATESPSVHLALRGLRMPGAAAARDVVVDASTAAALDDALLELVLGLVQAQLSAVPATSPLQGLASILGLADDDVPDFPIADLIARGPIALADWLASALSGAALQDWLGGLATLLGGSVVGGGTPDAAVEVTIGGAPVRLELRLSPGASSRPVVTARLSVGVSGGPGGRLALAADLASIDLGTGAPLALPRLAITGRLDPPGPAKLLPPVVGPAGLQVAVGALEVGFAIDANRRPVLVITAEDADVGATHFDVLDLSTPEALAAAANQAVTDAAAAIVGAIAGAAGDAVAILLGLENPASAPGIPRVDAVELLRDPVGAVRQRWQTLVTAHAASVPAVLESLKELADDRVRTSAIGGTGTPVDPWRVAFVPNLDLLLARDGDRLTIAVEGRAANDLGATGIRGALALRADVARLDLTSGDAAFLPDVHATLTLGAASTARLRFGTAGFSASLSSIGVDLRWTPDAGVRVTPALADARLHLSSGDVVFPPLTIGPDGRLALDDLGWQAVERLAGALALDIASRADLPWLAAIISLLGWAPAVRPPSLALAPGVTVPLSLSVLIANPATAFEDFARTLVRDEDALRALLEALAGMLVRAGLGGVGATSRPWIVPLVAPTGPLADRPPATLPSLMVTLGAEGSTTPITVVPQALRAWLPGDDGLEPDALVDAIANDADLDDVLADLIAGRGDLSQGLVDLIDRWASTDGLVTLPEEGLPDGVTAHRPSELLHGNALAGPHITEVLDEIWAEHFGGAAPATVVFVAIEGGDRHGAPQVLPTTDDGFAADRVIDLTAPALPPEAFTPPPAPGGPGPQTWAIRLGSRAGCRVPASHPSGPDPDGIAGQAARLRRVLTPLAGTGADVAVVAHGGAGHAAVRAVVGLAGIRTVITIATPWSPVSVDSLDALPSGDALRLIAALLRIIDTAAADSADEAIDPNEGEDPDLLLARGVVSALLDLDPFADPVADIRPSGGLAAPAGVPVHAIVGSCSPPALRRALTATVAAALAARARARAREEAPAGVAPARAGIRLPIVIAGSPGGLSATVLIDLDLATVAREEGALLNGPEVRVRVSLGGSGGGWLVGGPDPGRASGGARLLACRRASAIVSLPIRSWGSPLPAPSAGARLVLHETTAFGTTRNRWAIEAAAGAGADATPLLPETRAILGEATARLATAATTDPAIAGLRDALGALGIVAPEGGLDAITLERLLLDPEPTVETARADEGRRLRLAAAIRAMGGDTRAASIARNTADLTYGASGELLAHIDLGAPAVTLTSIGSASVAGLPWAIDVSAAPAGINATARIGDDIPGAASSNEPGFALVLTASRTGLAAEFRQRGPSGIQTVGLWPTPGAEAIVDRLTAIVPGVAVHALLDALRSTLASTSTTTATAIDAVLDAIGLLRSSAAPSRPRSLRLPSVLLSDPAAWLQNRPGGVAAAIPGLVDAIRALLGGAGTAGTLTIADGVRLRATMQGARLLVAIDVDASGFTAPAGGLALVLTGGLGLSLSTTEGASLPDLRTEIGVSGVGAVRLRVGPDGGGAGDAIGVTLSLAPVGRPEIVLLPAGAGLGSLADAAAAGAIAALPALLDALAALDSAGAPTTAGELAGRIVTRVGDALALRTGAPLHFDQAALTSFGSDPAAALAARAAALGASGLTLLTQAVQPLLGSVPARSVSTADGALIVTVGPVTVRWRPGTSRVEGIVALTGLPGIESVAADVAVGPAGLELFDLTVGPASLDATVVTLSPYARIVTGTTRADGQLVEVGLGLGADRRLAFQWNLTTGDAGLAAVRLGATPADLTISRIPADVAAAIVGAVLDIAGSIALSVPTLATALGQPVLGTSTAGLLDGVLLAPGRTDRIDPAIAGELADPILLLRRLGRLAGNLAAAPGAAVPIEGILTVRMTRRDEGTTPIFGLNVAIDGAWELNPGDDVVVSLEEDTTWILLPSGTVPEGLTVELIDLPPTGPPRPRPGLVVGGLGVRLSRSSGPLLDAGVSIGSVALHLFGSIASSGSGIDLAGGVRLELGSLGVGLAGASGGDNAVAQGLMSQAGTGEDAPTPRFSPAIALQKHQSQPLRISLSAGPGSGPWWLTIQREFGPIYLEQIGLAVVNPPSGIESVGVLIDGRVSLMGLAAAVDDLSLTYIVAGGGSALDPSKWRVDLAGFAVSADIAGLTLAGGLRRFPSPQGGVEYLGMLMARVAVYGLTVYGGYGLVGPEHDKFTALFLFGAVNGPIGGPPAFFVTGIGGGFGINRRLSLPADLSQFGNFPMIKALDPAARPGDPFQELANARVYFAAERGTFWFAAGLSFNSFALVDGIAVLAIQIGGGFEMSLLGLARMALPRPEAALVSIELALVARFSTREGIILVQGQLTDNSWFLAPQVRLTGGFAFASWFSGPNRGQFVVTIGGYHPDFHRDGYPIVPRLGIAIRFGSNISITGESYFALTSEAMMAGTRMEVSARLGPAWAHLVFGGDGIVYFDPFWFKVTVYASIDAGVTIDVWIGEITISVHLSARVEVTGPPLHAIARFEVGPVGLTFEIGDRGNEPRPIPWDAFVRKYLEEAAPGRARVLAAAGGKGSIPPSGSSTTGGAQSPDGTPDRPFRVVAEFEMTITSTAPLRSLVDGRSTRTLAASAVVSVAPMGETTAKDVRLTLHMVGPPSASSDRIARLEVIPQQLGAFPVGVWGIAQDASHPVVPSGDVISATDRVIVRAIAEIPPGGPFIRYRQVETGARRLLPFVTEDDARRAAVVASTTALAGFIPDAANGQERLTAAATLLTERGGRSLADVAAWRADRSALPLLGSLGEGLGRRARVTETAMVAPPPAPELPRPRPPQVRALLIAAEADEPVVARPGAPPERSGGEPRTSVSERIRREVAHVIAPAPALADVDARLLAAVPARLLQVATPAARLRETVVAAVAPPLTRSVLAGTEIAAGRAAEPAAAKQLSDFARALSGRSDRAAHVAAGEVVVLELPDAARDVSADRRPALIVRNGAARVVALGPAGGVAIDRLVVGGSDQSSAIAIPPATRGIVVIGLAAGRSASGAPDVSESGISGWTAAAPLPSATDGVLIAAGCVVDAVGRVPERNVTALRSGWVTPDEVVRGESAVTTTFASPIAAVAVALEGGTGPDLVLGVEGAQRALAKDGSPEAPILVMDGRQSVLVFRLLESRSGTALTVTTGAARRLVSVAGMPGASAGGIDPVTALADAISRAGLAALVPPVARPGIGGADLLWKEQ